MEVPYYYQTRSRSRSLSLSLSGTFEGRIKIGSIGSVCSKSKSLNPRNRGFRKKAKKNDSLSDNLPQGAKETETDLLSTLPPGVKEHVITFLPIKEAVRTSLLSRDWRYTWASMPGLVICNLEIIFDQVGYFTLIKYVDGMIVLRNCQGHEFLRGQARMVDMKGIPAVNGEIPLEPALDFNGVKDIELRLNFEDENESVFLLAMLQRATHLQSLLVHVDLPGQRATARIAEFWKRADSRRRKGELGLGFNNPHIVTIVDMKAVDSIFSFLEFIISATRPVKLEFGKFYVHFDDCYKISEEVIKLKGMSPGTAIRVPKPIENNWYR